MILEGRTIKEKRIKELKDYVSKLERKPNLVVIQVGNNESSNIYVSNKKKTALEIGCNFEHIKYEEDIDENIILSKIDKLNEDKNVDGIIVQMPLPSNLNASLIQNRVSYKKDIDGLTDINSGLLFHNKDSLISCTPKGILELLNYYKINVGGKHVVIIGRSNLVGKPLMSLMLNKNATVTICHSYTNNLKEITKTADILISAVGKKYFIDSSFVKENSILIDVGITRENGKIYGDINFDDVKDKCHITPVPNGVGQMTILALFENLIEAYKNNLD